MERCLIRKKTECELANKQVDQKQLKMCKSDKMCEIIAK
jgi:hypothetical protein